MHKFLLMLGLAAVATTMLMADKCSVDSSTLGQKQESKPVTAPPPPAATPTPAPESTPKQ